MSNDTLKLIEFLMVFLGGGAAVLKFWPQFRAIAIVLQVAMFLLNIFNTYLKSHPDKKRTIQMHLAQMAEHYFKTHPEGKVIARFTDVDDKFHNYLDKEKTSKDPYDELYKLLNL